MLKIQNSENVYGCIKSNKLWDRQKQSGVEMLEKDEKWINTDLRHLKQMKDFEI